MININEVIETNKMIEKENHHNFVSMTLTLRFSIGYF